MFLDVRETLYVFSFYHSFNISSILTIIFVCQEHAKGGKSIVFTQTKRDADRLAYAMAKSLRCEALHGDISQAQRERTLAGFREGHFNVLVATDVASRGLDIPNVDLVGLFSTFLSYFLCYLLFCFVFLFFFFLVIMNSPLFAIN